MLNKTQTQAKRVDWAKTINNTIKNAVIGNKTIAIFSYSADQSLKVASRKAKRDVVAPHTKADASVRFSGDAAQQVIKLGLKATSFVAVASASALDAKALYEFTGVDRTTVQRKVAKNEVLSADATSKLLAATELIGDATEVFGEVDKASHWLTTAHPLLTGLTPLQSARNRWGAEKVRSMLVSLKYGGVV
jgi:putative toxin-antitoxin system antitoxin component (TIGR02293 family)